MSEIAIDQLIKIIIGGLVVVAVLIGVYFLFKYKIFDFFKNVSVETPSKIFLNLIK